MVRVRVRVSVRVRVRVSARVRVRVRVMPAPGSPCPMFALTLPRLGAVPPLSCTEVSTAAASEPASIGSPSIVPG